MKFKEIKPEMVIHCKAEDEAKELFKYLDSLWYKWRSDECLIDNTHFDEYGEDTCYFIYDNRTVSYFDYEFAIQRHYNVTEFSDLIIPEPELSAEEALLAYDQMCRENYCCNDCPIYGIVGGECAKRMDGHITEIVDAINRWKVEHEKKEPEIEWVYRVFGAENFGEKFFQTEEEAIKRCEELAKSQKTKQYARYERVCRVKAVE